MYYFMDSAVIIISYYHAYKRYFVEVERVTLIHCDSCFHCDFRKKQKVKNVLSWNSSTIILLKMCSERFAIRFVQTYLRVSRFFRPNILCTMIRLCKIMAGIESNRC